MRNLFVTAIAILSVTEAQAPPEFIILKGVARDFSCFHSDFQSPASSDYPAKGLLQPRLVRGSPVLVKPTERGDTCTQWYEYSEDRPYERCGNITIANYGSLMFDEYYQDTPGVNLAYDVSLNLTLVNSTSMMYQFSSNKFFPIDNQGFGRREWFVVGPLYTNSYDGERRNFWFTTEFRTEFYYRGGEIFAFEGDDDLFVFIDGRLSTCDVGGIHPPSGCLIELDRLGLEVGRAYSMDVFHAERHTEGSNFKLTTSIRPINRPPAATNQTTLLRASQLKENPQVTLPMVAFDPDDDPTTFAVVPPVLILPPRSGSTTGGTAEVPIIPTKVNFNLQNATEAIITMTVENRDFLGTIVVPYRASDPDRLSETAYVHVTVLPSTKPPVFINDTVLRATVDEAASATLEAIDEDTPIAELRWYVLENPELGYLEVDEMTGKVNLRAVNEGEERVRMLVSDQTHTGEGFITIRVEALAGLSTGGVVGVVLGTIAAVALLAIAAAYLIYTHLAAGRFEAMWQKEFQSAQIKDNPLFVSNTTEAYNPLFAGG